MNKLLVKLIGLDYGQDVGPLIKAFFKDYEIKTEYDENYDGSELIPLPDYSNQLIFGLEASYIRFLCVYDGTAEVLTDDFSSTPELCYSNPGVPDRRTYRNHLHRLIYTCLSKKLGMTLPWGTMTGVRPTKQVLELKRLQWEDEKIIRYLSNEYFCSEQKARLSLRVTENEERLLSKAELKDSYSLYVGVPFCPSICLYCSFSSYPLKQYAKQVGAYVDALIKELTETAKLFKNKKLITIYFGGGTPTTLEAAELERVIKHIKSTFDLSNLSEWTVEAGRPDSITPEKLQVLKNEGITRISVNPQTMQQKTLDLIGRRHTVTQVLDSYHLARQMGFDNINMDLIAGLNGENIDDFTDTLKQIKELKPDSVTIHTLAVKRAARLTEKMDEYRDNMARDTYLMTEEGLKVCNEMGLEPYYLYRQKNMSDNLENVGYASPGKEGLYNVLIMEECHTIAACGAGASSKLVRSDDVYGEGYLDDSYDNEYHVRKIERVENVKSVKDYIERIDEMIERKRKLFGE